MRVNRQRSNWQLTRILLRTHGTMFVFVNVFVTDENGTVVPDADDLINFKVGASSDFTIGAEQVFPGLVDIGRFAPVL